MPAVKFFACLDLDPICLFLDGHYECRLSGVPGDLDHSPAHRRLPVLQYMGHHYSLKPFLRKPLDALGIKFPFQCQAFSFNAFKVIVLGDRKTPLTDNRSGILAVIHKMHRASAHLASIPKRVAISVHTGKRGQQGRMNIHDARLVRVNVEAIDEIGAEIPHKTGQHQQIGVKRRHLSQQTRFGQGARDEKPLTF
jgi:hypothetical protein